MDLDSTLSSIEAATECGGELILFPNEPPIIGDVVLAGTDGRLYSRLMISGADLGSWPVGGAGRTEHPVEVAVPDGVLAICRGRCNSAGDGQAEALDHIPVVVHHDGDYISAFPRKPAVLMVRLGPLSEITCPNGAACPHDIEQHRFEPDRERWVCAVDDCWENPYRTVRICSPAAGLTAASYSRLREVHGPDVTFEFFEYPHMGVDDRPSWWQRLWRWR